MARASATHGVDSARRVLQILLSFSEAKPEATVQELAAATSITVSSAYRYVSLLREMALIEERRRGVYVLSPRVLTLARASAASQDVVSLARPILHELTDVTNETSFLVRRVGDSAVCVESVLPDQQIRLSFSPGELMPMHRGASAKVLLADLSAAKRDRYLDRVTPLMSKAERDRLRRELEEIRDSRYAESTAEVDEGVWAAAAPVLSGSRVVAALSIVALQYRTDQAKRDLISDLVKSAATRLSELVGANRVS